MVLPSVPLQTGGPALEHLGKTRPKPARMQRGRSSKKPSIQPAVSDANSTPPVTDPVSPTVAAPAAKVALKPPPAVVEKKRQSSEVRTISYVVMSFHYCTFSCKKEIYQGGCKGRKPKKWSFNNRNG